MKHLTFFLVLILFCVCRAKYPENKGRNVVTGRSDDDVQEQNPRTESEGVDRKQELQSDIWAELMDLRDMVVEQGVMLKLLTDRVAAAETTVRSLEKENAAQTAELAVAHEKLCALQEGLVANVGNVEEMQVELEEQKANVKDLQSSDRARKLAFSASLLTQGEGNSASGQLAYRHVITNIGNHYNPTTGAFTAPVRGVYYFRITGHVAHSDSSTRLGIFKSGQLLVTSGDRHTHTDLEDNVSNGVAIQLEVGDVVSVQLSGVVWDDQYHRTTFTGFLLFSL